MYFLLYLIMGYSIFIAAVISIARFKQIDAVYHPFMICIWVGSFNEILSTVLVYSGHSTFNNSNIYVLLESLLITWQFKRWGIFQNRMVLYRVILGGLLALWIVEYVGKLTGTTLNFYFRMVYSFIIVMMSVHLNNRLILSYRKTLWLSPIFIICSGFIIYFTFKIFVEALYLYGIQVNPILGRNIYRIHSWLNFIVNLLFALAFICIPRKPQFIQLSSSQE